MYAYVRAINVFGARDVMRCDTPPANHANTMAANTCEVPSEDVIACDTFAIRRHHATLRALNYAPALDACAKFSARDET